MFKKATRNVNDNEFTWKKNVIKIENDYLLTGGTLHTTRIPLDSIETVVWSLNPLKPTIAPNIRIIGKGVILAELPIGLDIINDVQDWILEKINN